MNEDRVPDELAEEIKAGEWSPTAEFHPYQHDEPLPSGRVPHFGHALLFFGITGLLLLVTQAIMLLPAMHGQSPTQLAQQHPKLVLASEAASYLLTLTISWFVFPLLWHRSFANGLAWNGSKALQLAGKLIPLGILAGWTVQGISSLISMPKSMPMDDFFRSSTDVWLVTIFGTLLAPLFEEVCFRGFLLPALTIAFDWLGAWSRYLVRFSSSRAQGDLPPEDFQAFPEARTASLETGNMAYRSTAAIALSSLVTSTLFGLLHAQQLGYTWPAVLLLGCVSLILTAVRLHTRSVACSALVHASYNFSVFLALFVATGGYRHLDRMAR
ncbi:MAG TPA: type II CAAX endopeptidase family protein [Granulicella sp.]